MSIKKIIRSHTNKDDLEIIEITLIHEQAEMDIQIEISHNYKYFGREDSERYWIQDFRCNYLWPFTGINLKGHRQLNLDPLIDLKDNRDIWDEGIRRIQWYFLNASHDLLQRKSGSYWQVCGAIDPMHWKPFNYPTK